MNGEDAEWKKGHARLNRTIAALMSRGVGSDLAEKLRTEGFTLNALSQKTPEELDALGMPAHAIDNILKGSRPPIPFQSLARVLIANQFTCCICRKHSRPVIVHHMRPWAQSRDHSEPNLAVLCLLDHDRAHRSGGLTQNLTPDLIRAAKSRWEEKVSRLDARALLDASAIDSDSWWLFNHVRLFELADGLEVILTHLQDYEYLRSAGLVSVEGRLTIRDRHASYMYEGRSGIALYAFARRVLGAVLERLTVLNISDDFDRGFLAAVLKIGDFVVLQGAYVFTSTVKKEEGPGQGLIGRRKANRVELFFAADRWEATSNSAWAVWLRGRQDAVCLLRIMSVEDGPDGRRIGATAIAIGAALQGIKTREYANLPYRRGYYALEGFYDGEDVGEDEFDWEQSPDNPANYRDEDATSSEPLVDRARRPS